MRGSRLILAPILTLVLGTAVAGTALAHRPYIEEKDLTPDTAWRIDDPAISTAFYATLESALDVDYFTFSGKAGQDVLLGLTIPQIDGQELFAPALALIGPGLAKDDLPGNVVRPAGSGGYIIRPVEGPATAFFEPFSRTSYWERQEDRVTLPADGQYTVAVWHPAGQTGRYVLVVGDRELPGGDLTFPIKMRTYWTPVKAAVGRPTPLAAPSERSCRWAGFR